MKLKELKEQLSHFDDDIDVVLFSNGYKEIKIVDSEDGVIIAGKGNVFPSVKMAIENGGRDAELYDLCSSNNKDDNSK